MKISDLTPEEKNEIVKDFVSPSEQKLVEMAKYISTQQMQRFDDASMFHAWIKESAKPVTKKYYGKLFLAMMAEKDQFIVEALKISDEVWEGAKHLVNKPDENNNEEKDNE